MWRLTFYTLLWMQIIFAAEILVFALLKHNPETYLDEFQAWLEYQTGKLYAKRTVSRTSFNYGRTIRQGGIVRNKKVMKAARD